MATPRPQASIAGVKRPRLDDNAVHLHEDAPAAAPGVSGAGSGGEGGGGGAPGGFENVVHGLSNHSASSWTITSGGTSWLNTTDTGNVGADWTLFPWEFPSLFMSNNERIDLYNDYLFWRCKSVNVRFKNFRGYVNTVSASETVPNTFPTDNAAFMTYLDEMYFMGIQMAPFQNETGWVSDDDLINIVQSWQKGGYNGTASSTTGRVSLPVFDITVNEQVENYIAQNTPNVSQTQAIAGQSKEHNWHTVGDKYWRDTSEFLWGLSPRGGMRSSGGARSPLAPLNEGGTLRPFRADQFGGILLSGGVAETSYNLNGSTNLGVGTPASVLPNSGLFNSPTSADGVYSRENAMGIAMNVPWPTASTGSILPSYPATQTDNFNLVRFAGIPPVVYTTHEPIPPLLLRIVPQHIEGNGNSTHIQFDFEITYNIEVRCKIPRHGYTNARDLSTPAGFAQQGTSGIKSKNRPGSATPVKVYFPAAQWSTNAMEEVVGPEYQGVQRGRTKNGFCFIPYGGWEHSLGIFTGAPTPAPPVSSEALPKKKKKNVSTTAV